MALWNDGPRLGDDCDVECQGEMRLGWVNATSDSASKSFWYFPRLAMRGGGEVCGGGWLLVVHWIWFAKRHVQESDTNSRHRLRVLR